MAPKKHEAKAGPKKGPPKPKPIGKNPAASLALVGRARRGR